MRTVFHSLRVVAGATLFILALCAQAQAASFEDYRGRVSQAVSAIQQLEAPDYYTDDPLQRDSVMQTALDRLRQLLPARESVLFNGQNIDVDNAWFHQALDEYQKLGHQPERATGVLYTTRDQLRALLERLNEMKPASSTDEKDSSKARLAEILRRPEYDKSVAEKSAIERLWEEFMRWLSKLIPRFGPLQPGTGQALSGVAQVIVIGFSVLLIAFLIWKFLPRYLRNRGNRKKKAKREPRIVLGERLEPDQTASDLLEQAEALARTGDLRGAIRKAYIALLCELGDRKVIMLAQHKTNRDYLMAVRNRQALYEPLRKLTASFEVHWYGFVPPAPTDWEAFRLGCRKAVTSGK
jgi:hypothetical protein